MASTTGSDAHAETLDYIRAFRELALVSWRSAVSRKPHGPLLRATLLGDAVELLPGKSLDTRPDGSPWTSGLENVATPASLDDLGSFTLGDRVDAASLLRDGQRILLPYHVSAPHRCHVLVQHEPGHRPTEASFLFVGQRQRVARVCAVPWTEADRLAESLPEATALGPVLFLQMVARCGSTVLCHGMEWMGLGCQSVSEPDVIGDVHEMLERRLCSRADAVRALRTSLLLLIHRLRRDRPAAPMIVIKPRSLTGVWRHCELLPEALPGARQVLQWRRIDHVVGSLDRAIVGGMVSPPTRWLHARGLDGLLWRLQGGAINHFLRRLATTLATEPALEWDRHAGLHLDADAFAAHGALGFQALNCIFTWHVATVLGARGLWECTLSYEALMHPSGRSACVRRLLDALGWLPLVPPTPMAALGTARADAAFELDAHARGGLRGGGGGGGALATADDASAQAAPPTSAAYRPPGMQTEHLRAPANAVLGRLLALHAPLLEAGYRLDCGRALEAA